MIRARVWPVYSPLPTQKDSSRSTLYVCESSAFTCVAAAREALPLCPFPETMMK